jgi:hypothetical protein
MSSTPQGTQDAATDPDRQAQAKAEGGAQGRLDDADKAAREAEIRVEYRKLQQARDAYYGRRWPPFRESWGFGERSSVEDVLRVADAFWDGVVQQDGVVQGLLATYASVYGDTSRDDLLAKEQMNMAPPSPQHTTRDQRQALREAMSRRMSEAMSQAMQNAASGKQGKAATGD